jgi:hypothetical protein
MFECDARRRMGCCDGRVMGCCAGQVWRERVNRRSNQRVTLRGLRACGDYISRHGRYGWTSKREEEVCRVRT